MVDGRFLDVDAVLSAIRRSDSLKPAALDAAEHTWTPSMMGRKMQKNLERETRATENEWWEWERESCIWEVREEMEKWAMSFRTKEEFKENKPTSSSFHQRPLAASALSFTASYIPISLFK